MQDDENQHACETKKIYDYRDFAAVRHFKKDDRFVDLDTSQHHLTVQGDVKIQFYEKLN